MKQTLQLVVAKLSFAPLEIAGRAIPFLILLGVLTVASTKAECKALGWGDSFQYDTGRNPSVAIAFGGDIVEVHQSEDGVGPLWYRVGGMDGFSIQWGDSSPYDIGRKPAVAIAVEMVVEVHQSDEGVGPLWYRVGQLDGFSIQWGDSFQYDTGQNPSVAIGFGGDIAEVHQSEDGVGPLWYRVGQLDGFSIQWGDSFQYDTGRNPAVAIQFDTLVEVHQTKDGVGLLRYRVGRLNGNNIQWWGGGSQYDSGLNPAVGLSGGLVVEVHQAEAEVGPLFSRRGGLAHPGISWEDSFQFESAGLNPSLALLSLPVGTAIIEVQQAQDGVGPLLYRVGGWPLAPLTAPLTMPVLGRAAAQKIEGALPVAEYSARPDPRECAAYPQCGGYLLYKIDDTILAGNQDLCSADLPLAAYVVRVMCPIDDGSLVDFYPYCNKPIFGHIEPDPDYKDYYTLVSVSCYE